MGDDVQAIKAGIMEIADIFVINKADQPGADRVEQELQGMLSLAHGNTPPIIRTVALDGTGVAELAALLGRTPWSAADPLVGLQAHPQKLDGRSEKADEGVGRGPGGPPHMATVPDHHHAGQVGDLPQTTEHRSGGLCHIDHLGIAVPALDAAIAFYQTLGLSVTHRETVATEEVNVAMLPAGESRIELLEPASPDSPISKFLEKRGPGLHHVALQVPDLPAAVARLKIAGARLLNEPRQGAGGHLYVFVHPASTGGVLLELIQESGH